MRRMMRHLGVAVLALLLTHGEADAAGRGRGGRAGAAAGGTRAGSYTGPHGTTVNARAGAYAGPRGAAAGAAHGVKVTGPNGNTYEHGSAHAAAAGPRGAAAWSATGTAVSGAGGAAYEHGSAHAAAAGPRGATAWGAAGTAVAGAGGAAYAHGARGGAAVRATDLPVNAGLARYTQAYGVARAPAQPVTAGALYAQGQAARAGWAHGGCFTPAWYAAHPPAWRPPAAGVWVAPSWPAVSASCDVTGAPVYYDSGTTVVYPAGNVSSGVGPAATEAEYAGQAAALAQGGSPGAAAGGGWQPLAVFALVQGGETDSNMDFQLSVSKQGAIAGTYYNARRDTALPVHGSVDRKRQRGRRGRWGTGRARCTRRAWPT